MQVKNGEGGAMGRGTADKVLREELLVAARRGREAHMSGVGQWMGALSRWTAAPRPGELLGEKRLQR